MRFNPLDHPLIFMQPDHLRESSWWMEHIPFAFLLMDLARPRTVVELGTESGVSYCAFCQGIAKLHLQARCHAIDTWQGDAHAGHYSAKTLEMLRSYHDPRYGSFSELVQSTFDAAVGRFADGSIDVLHIDGLHTLEAVRHDYQTWRPKLSDAGIVLFHDTTVTQDDFGVYQLWAELEKQFPSFEFKHGNGLGVLGVGRNLPPGMLEFFEDANANCEAVRHLFTALGKYCALQFALTFMVRQQQAINQWKRQIGAEANPALEEFQTAFSYPIAYARLALDDVRALAKDDLELRQRNNPGSKQ
jgi:hypothetical protein